MSDISEAKKKLAFSKARNAGYPERIIARAWLMHLMDSKKLIEKDWDVYLNEADDGTKDDH